MAMNENSTNSTSPSDEEILDGIRNRLSGVERLVVAPPAWSPTGTAAAGRTRGDRMTVRVQPRGAFGFGAALVILVVAVVGAASLGALGPRNPGGSGASPTAFVPVTTVVYQLVTPAGVNPTTAELESTVQILKSRANSTHPEGLQVTAQSPNLVSVSVSGAVDIETLRLLLGHAGKLELVLLPPETYGTAFTPGVEALPVKGDLIDPALPAQFTDADMDAASFGVSQDPGSPDRSAIDFAFTPAATTKFDDWTGQHVGDYFALALDGVVQSVPYVFAKLDGAAGQISGYYSTAAAETLVAMLRTGPLPFPVNEVSVAVSTPGPRTSAQASTSPLSIGKTPTGVPVTAIEYQLVPQDGSQPTRAELGETVRMLAYRMTLFFPTYSYPNASGQVLPDLNGVAGFSVTGVLPDRVIVRYRAEVTAAGPDEIDAASIRVWLGRTGRLALVDLPPAIYGTVGVPGPDPLPSRGQTVDPLPAIVTAADIASYGGSSGDNPDAANLRLDFNDEGSARMASYSSANTGHYLALTLDGVVLATTEMAGQGRFGTLQMTITTKDSQGLAWLNLDGNSPLPVPLVERSYATSMAPGSPAPGDPTFAPYPPAPPTAVPVPVDSPADTPSIAP
jgi:hypothetical protein